jgi:hypothetical protein
MSVFHYSLMEVIAAGVLLMFIGAAVIDSAASAWKRRRK